MAHMYFCNFLEELEALQAFIDMETSSHSKRSTQNTFPGDLNPCYQYHKLQWNRKEHPIYLYAIPQMYIYLFYECSSIVQVGFAT